MRRYHDEAAAARGAERDGLTDAIVYRCPAARNWHVVAGDADMGLLLQSAHRVVAHAFTRWERLPASQVAEALAKVSSSPNKLRKVLVDLLRAGLIEMAGHDEWRRLDPAGLSRVVRVGWTEYRQETSGPLDPDQDRPER